MVALSRCASTLIRNAGTVARFAFRGRVHTAGDIVGAGGPIVVMAVPMASFTPRGLMINRGRALMHTALTLPTTILVISRGFMAVRTNPRKRSRCSAARRCALAMWCCRGTAGDRGARC